MQTHKLRVRCYCLLLFQLVVVVRCIVCKFILVATRRKRGECLLPGLWQQLSVLPKWSVSLFKSLGAHISVQFFTQTLTHLNKYAKYGMCAFVCGCQSKADSWWYWLRKTDATKSCCSSLQHRKKACTEWGFMFWRDSWQLHKFDLYIISINFTSIKIILLNVVKINPLVFKHAPQLDNIKEKIHHI